VERQIVVQLPPQLGQRRRRLHGGVRQMRAVILRGDHFGGRRERLLGIALIALDLTGLAHILVQHRPVGI